MSVGRLLRAELDTTSAVAKGLLYRAELSTSTGVGNKARLYRAELLSPPAVNAGVNIEGVEPYSTVQLNGSDSGGSGASRSWLQTGGPVVTINNGTTKTPDFKAPGAIAGTTVEFQYNVDGATDLVSVTVQPVTERAAIGGVWVPMELRSLES